MIATTQMVGRALLLAFTTRSTSVHGFFPTPSHRGGIHLIATASSCCRFVSSVSADTPTLLPEFTSQEEYLEYLQGVSALPKGFATGSAEGKFVSVEAPSMGELTIRGTIIALTEGPTDNWAAVFTTNKVSLPSLVYFVVSGLHPKDSTNFFSVPWSTNQSRKVAIGWWGSIACISHQQQSFECLFRRRWSR